jgi:hypothetical protein
MRKNTNMKHLNLTLSPSGGEGRGEGDFGNQKLEIRNQKDSVSASSSDFRLLISDFRQPPHPNPLPPRGRGKVFEDGNSHVTGGIRQ